MVRQQLANNACDAGPDTRHFFEAFDAAMPVHDVHRDRPVAHRRCRLRVGANVHRISALAAQRLCGVVETPRDHPIQ